jgi:hypothetical protein
MKRRKRMSESVRDALDALDLDAPSETDDKIDEDSDASSEEESPEDDESTEEEESESSDKDESKETEEEPESTSKEFKVPSLITRVKQKFGKEVFKEFPELEDAYFKWKEVSQLHGTVEEVKESQEKALYLDQIGEKLVEGDIEPILDAAYEADPNSVTKIAHSFLPLLREKSPKLFSQVIHPVVVNVLAKVAKDAEAMGNENLLTAVRYINKHMFDDDGVPRRMELPKFDKGNDEVKQERNKLAAEREFNFYSNVESKSDPVISRIVAKNLDPKGRLPEGIREVAINNIKAMVYQMLTSDKAHMSKMAALKRTAMANGYNGNYAENIAKEILASAKELIPIARGKVVKKLGIEKILYKGEGDGKVDKSIPSHSSGTISTGSGGKLEVDKIDWGKTSIRDAMDAAIDGKGNVHLKK